MNKHHKGSIFLKFQYFTISLFLLLTSISFAQLASNQTQRYYFIGTLDGEVIQLDITFQEETLSGEYFFEDDGPRFSLSGDLMAAGNSESNPLWAMATFSNDSEALDLFEVEFVNPRFHYDGPDSELDNVALRGSWTSGAGSTPLDFEAYAVAEYVFLTMTNGDHIEIDVSYPYFLAEPWQSLNDSVTGNISDMIDFFQEGQRESEEYNVMGWASSESVRIHYLSSSLVSLEDAGWIYLGGAHGNSASIGRNFAQLEGDWIELELSDFFDDGADFVSEVEPSILLELEQKEAAWILDGSTTNITEEDLYSVLVSPKGLDISFDPYHMGPYAQGHISINLPFEYIGPVLNEDGPLKEVLELSAFDPNDY